MTRSFLESLPIQDQKIDRIEKNDFLVDEEDDVVGGLATIRLKDGDTLPDIARHFSLGINAVSAANPGVDVWVPKAGDCLILPLRFILPEARREGIVINLAAMRLFSFKKESGQRAVSTFPVGVGTEERPTPMGQMYITRKKFRPTWYVPASIAADHRERGDPLPDQVQPGPLNPLGEYALYLSKSGYLVHGTNKPASIGLRATNGCLRLYPEDINRLYADTPVRTPVEIVSQPYLVGRHNGMVFMEAHPPYEPSGTAELNKAYMKLKKIERQTGHALDWDKVKAVVAETRGIPVVVSALGPRGESAVTGPIRLRHPAKLYGQLQLPAWRTDAWYVLAADFGDGVDAKRLAAILNHQGPPIPARVLSTGGRHRVLAGPFDNRSEAEGAINRLQIDLDIEGLMVAPVDQGITTSGN